MNVHLKTLFKIKQKVEQKNEATVYSGSPKLDNRRLENVAWTEESVSAMTFMCKRHGSILAPIVQTSGDVRVWEISSWHTCTCWASYKDHSLSECSCWSCLFLWHSVPSSDSCLQTDKASCHRSSHSANKNRTLQKIRLSCRVAALDCFTLTVY